jgi:hypothetical protein
MKVAVVEPRCPSATSSSPRSVDEGISLTGHESDGNRPDPVGRCHPMAGPRIPDALRAELRRLLAAILVADYRENADRITGSGDEG